MAQKNIPVDGSSESDSIPVRRRNTPGPTTKAISVTVPIELNEKLESMAKPGEKSYLITELLNEALAARGQEG